jgi:hypothetical protein
MERYAQLPGKAPRLDAALSPPFYSVERVCGSQQTPSIPATERALPKPLAPISPSETRKENPSDEDRLKSSPERLPAPSSRSDREGDPGAPEASEDDLTVSFRRLEQAAIAVQKSVMGLPKAPARETSVPLDEVMVANVPDPETATAR